MLRKYLKIIVYENKIYSRINGYYISIKNCNIGKISEFKCSKVYVYSNNNNNLNNNICNHSIINNKKKEVKTIRKV